MAQSRASKLKGKQVTEHKLRTALTQTACSIKKMHRGPIVTEHATLRYAERVLGLDVQEIEKAILTPEVVSFIKTFKHGKISVGHGMRAVIEDCHVITIEPSD